MGWVEDWWRVEVLCERVGRCSLPCGKLEPQEPTCLEVQLHQRPERAQWPFMACNLLAAQEVNLSFNIGDMRQMILVSNCGNSNPLIRLRMHQEPMHARTRALAHGCLGSSQVKGVVKRLELQLL